MKSAPGRSGTSRPVAAGAGDGGEQQDDLGLDRIGVLELVHEEPAVLPLERLAHVGPIAQEDGGELEQVAVVQGDGVLARPRGVLARVEEEGHREAVDVAPPRAEEGDRRVALEAGEERIHASPWSRDAAPACPASPSGAWPGCASHMRSRSARARGLVQVAHREAAPEVARPELQRARGARRALRGDDPAQLRPEPLEGAARRARSRASARRPRGSRPRDSCRRWRRRRSRSRGAAPASRRA